MIFPTFASFVYKRSKKIIKEEREGNLTNFVKKSLLKKKLSIERKEQFKRKRKAGEENKKRKKIQEIRWRNLHSPATKRSSFPPGCSLCPTNGNFISLENEVGTLEFPAFRVFRKIFPTYFRRKKRKKKKIGKTFLSFRFFSSSFPPSPSSFYFSFLSNELKNSPLSRFPTEPMSNKGEKDSGNNSVLASRQRCSSRVYSTCHSRFAVTIVICNGNPSHILPIVAKTLVPLSLFLSLSCTPLAKPTSTVSIPLYSTTVPSFILLRFPRVRDPPMFQYGFF